MAETNEGRRVGNFAAVATATATLLAMLLGMGVWVGKISAEVDQHRAQFEQVRTEYGQVLAEVKALRQDVYELKIQQARLIALRGE